jgi:hypothetical protein
MFVLVPEATVQPVIVSVVTNAVPEEAAVQIYHWYVSTGVGEPTQLAAVF